MPGVFSALLALYVSTLKLGWFPTFGMATLGPPPSRLDSLWHLTLPALVLSLESMAGLKRSRAPRCWKCCARST